LTKNQPRKAEIELAMVFKCIVHIIEIQSIYFFEGSGEFFQFCDKSDSCAYQNTAEISLQLLECWVHYLIPKANALELRNALCHSDFRPSNEAHLQMARFHLGLQKSGLM
jgi:hypothetical protein